MLLLLLCAVSIMSVEVRGVNMNRRDIDELVGLVGLQIRVLIV